MLIYENAILESGVVVEGKPVREWARELGDLTVKEGTPLGRSTTRAALTLLLFSERDFHLRVSLVDKLTGLRIRKVQDEDWSGTGCGTYVFDHVLRQPWFSSRVHEWCYDPLWIATDSYLRKKGFTRRSKDEAPDLVAYVALNSEGAACTRHFGIVRNGHIQSQFGSVGLYSHSLAGIPLDLGNRALFYRAPPKESA